MVSIISSCEYNTAMERMKKKGYYLLPFLFSLILFIIPFFWLKPGWMDLGGDSSRLYFFDPVHYLQSLPLYGITPDGIGVEVTGYFLIPFVLLLFVLKSILQSSYLLITFFNSFTLVVSFLSMYLISIEFLQENKTKKNNYLNISLIGCIVGLFYVFSPMVIINGWSKALSVHNNIFINPLIFYLLLKYLNSKKSLYLLLSLLVTFIFAPNFSPSPYFFSFFLIIFLYLGIYTFWVKKTSIPLKDLLLVGTLGIGMHLFHLLPLFLNFFSSNSAVYSTTFSPEGQLIRGMNYFTSVASSTNLTNNIFNLTQQNSLPVVSKILAIISPIIIVVGFLIHCTKFNKKSQKNKNFLLLGVFFLFTLFWVTANITHIGFFIYKSLFRVPGFSMFRNYVGQFTHTYIFFYALLIGEALYYVFSVFNSFQRGITVFFLFVLFVVNGWGFIHGDQINYILNPQSKTKITVPIKMDPEYAKLLSYIRSNSIDGKYLTAPLTDFAYQMIAGEQGGAYQGPSTIAYLTGKKDFSGYQDFTPFNDVFFRLAKDKDYVSIQRLLQILNIRYLFFNADPYIYNNFPTYPYEYTKTFFPTQDFYKFFFKNLNVQDKTRFGKYFIYEINNFIPHFYIPVITAVSNNILDVPLIADVKNSDTVFFNIDTYKYDTNLRYLEPQNITMVNSIRDNYHLHQHNPFISHHLDSLIYPLVPILEKYQLKKSSSVPDQYVDMSLLILSKRLAELNEHKNIKVLHHTWVQPKAWEFYKGSTYNYWEAGFSRYQQQAQDLIDWVGRQGGSKSWKDMTRIKINEQLSQHQLKFMNFINDTGKEKTYLTNLTKKMFTVLFKNLSVPIIDPTLERYSIYTSERTAGTYTIYFKKRGEDLSTISATSFSINKSTFPLSLITTEKGIIQTNKQVTLYKGDNTIQIKRPFKNLSEGLQWQSSIHTNTLDDSDSFTYDNPVSSYDGIFLELKNQRPQTQYVISFDYLTGGNDFIYKFFDVSYSKDHIRESHTYVEKLINSTDWKQTQSIVTTHEKINQVYLQLQSFNEKKSTIKIKNVSIITVPNPDELPTIVFKKNLQEPPVSSSKPQITFTRINPTKYTVFVKNATKPFTLVFLEAFSTNWKVYPELNKIEDKIPVAANYNNGEINEGVHTNTFLDWHTFETFGLDPLDEKKHFIANGYANAWQISPDDTDNKSTYKLVVELNSQKYFYLALIVSLFCVILCLIFLLRNIFLIHKK